MLETVSDCEFLVRTLARRYARREADLDDCEQEARIAALVALREWKPETGKISQKNYVGFRIKHALKEYVRSRYRPGFVSLDENAGADEGFTGHDTIGTAASQEEAVRAARIAERLATLPERLRGILQLRGEGNTQEEIASELGISQERVGQLNRRALDQIGDVRGERLAAGASSSAAVASRAPLSLLP